MRTTAVAALGAPAIAACGGGSGTTGGGAGGGPTTFDVQMTAGVPSAGTSAHGSGQKDFGALMVAKDSPVRDVRQLAGKTVAVNTLNNIAEVVVKASLRTSGVDPEQVTLARRAHAPRPPRRGLGAELSKPPIDYLNPPPTPPRPTPSRRQVPPFGRRAPRGRRTTVRSNGSRQPRSRAGPARLLRLAPPGAKVSTATGAR